jgi:FkbM family methyltransferase
MWEPNVTFWIEKLSSDGLFIDVGANIGYCSLIASKHYSNVIAFEPIPENFKLLEKSISDNKITNIKVISKCVGQPTEQKLELTTFLTNMGGTRNINNTKKQNVSHLQTGSTAEYDVISLDEFTKDIKSIAMLKIDVEGHELQVLNGFSEGLKTKKCKNIILELSPCSVANDICIETLLKFKNNGYFIYNIGCCEVGNIPISVGCSEILDISSFVKQIHQTNILATQTPI